MKPLSLRLRGFLGLRAGVGLNEVFLDLESLPDGIIAITGPNGMGKTTILDNLHPYRLMPYKLRKSRDWSPSAFSYYDQTYGPDACKELVFDMGGVVYRSLIMIDADRKKQEAYLHRREGSDWLPLNDGKTKTYDEAVERIVGSPSLYFNSVFRAQGARNISDAPRGEVMGLFGELLNIDHIKEQSDKCRFVVSALSSDLDALRTRMSDMQIEIDKVGPLREALAGNESRLATDQLGLEAARGDLDDVRGNVMRFREIQAASESERARRDLLLGQLADYEKRLQEGERSIAKRKSDHSLDISRLQAEHDRWLSDISSRIARAEKITSGAAAIRKATENERLYVAKLQTEKEALPALEQARDGAFRAVSIVDADIVKLKSQIASFRKDAGKLDGLDCHSDNSGWLNSNCRFIKDAIVSRDTLPGLEFELDAIGSGGSQRSALTDAENALSEIKKSIHSLEVALEECRKLTRLVPELEQAELNLVEWRTEIEKRKADHDEKLERLRLDLDLLDVEWSHDSQNLLGHIGSLKSQVADITVSEDCAGEIRNLAIKEGAVLASISGFETRIRSNELEMATLKSTIESIMGKSEAVSAMEALEKRYAHEISTHSLLMKGCSNDGVPALELDDAAPSITAKVNDLLRECYGSRYSVRIDTQVEKADGGSRETFDIVVLDSDTGLERSISECSGGQVNWIEDAITRGISLFNIHRSDRIYGALFSDEKDGALDDDRKQEFFSVKRRALAIGTHKQEFFISQTPDLIAMADGCIRLESGSVTIN